MRLLRNPLTWLGLLSSIVALALTVRGLRWSSLASSIAGANYALLTLAVAILLVSLVTRALRWKVLLSPQPSLRTWHVFGALNVGYALNNLLPLRVGELGRAYLISQKGPVPAGRALSSILVERLLDIITVVALLVVVLPFIDAPAWARAPALLVGLGFLAFAALLAIASVHRARIMPLVNSLVRVLPASAREPAARAIEEGLEGFAVLAQPSVIARAGGWSVVSWLLSATVMYIVMRAFALDVPFSAGMFVMSATALGMVVPSSPGYIGVFHAIAIESLVNVFGVDRNDAASVAIVLHAILYLTPIALGGIYMVAEAGTWDAVRAWSRQPAPDTATHA